MIKKRIWIPEVPKEKICELAKKIKPVIYFNQCGLSYIKPVDIFELSFTRRPQFNGGASFLEVVCSIRTYHECNPCGFCMFGPTIAEVLVQIPEEYLDKVVAFQVLDKEIDRTKEEMEAGIYVAETVLYVPMKL